MRALVVVLCSLLFASVAQAGDTIRRGAAPEWVKIIPPVTQAAQTPSGDAFRVEVLDQQFHFDGERWHAYARTRTAALSPQALMALGTVALPWNPVTQDITVHALDVVRGGQRIDALADRSFAVLRRETNLEAAIVDGLLTATLQLDDFRVGDRLELAYSISTRMPVLGDHAEFLASGAVGAVVDQYFLRASWPTSMGMRVRTSQDWPTPDVQRRGDRSEIEIALSGLEPVLVPQDAPVRFHHVRRLEGSDYGTWADLAAVFDPLYAEASVLAGDSALRIEVERIRADNPTVQAQVIAALRLVQDEVRYLALAMGEGGLIPASADETWNRRLGDCKGKTVLLLALLRELGVSARPVLASTVDDALDQRLPTVSAFDHVFVQAEVDGQIAWLDGTRVGDRSLVAVSPWEYGWVLPVKPEGAALERLPEQPPAEVLRSTTIEIDLSKGLYAEAPVTGDVILKGDMAAMLQSQFAVAQQTQRDDYVRSVWEQLVDDLEVVEAGSSYDVDRNQLRLSMTGKTKMDWSSAGGRRAEIPLSRISWSAGERRLAGPFRDLPFVINPTFSRIRTTVILPENGEDFVVNAEEISQEAAGYRFGRRVTKDGARVIMERETIALRSEITEAERAAAVEPLLRLGRQSADIVAPRSYEATLGDLDALDTAGARTPEELVNRGLALSDNNRVPEAIAAYDEAIALDPSHANAYANRGISRFWMGDVEQAAADFDKATELEPSERVAINGRGLIALQQERYLDAVVEFTMSLRAQPDDVFVLSARSQAYHGMEEWDKALADLHRVRTLRPESRETDMGEVVVLLSAERFDEARAAADALVERDLTNLEAIQLQATTRDRAGDVAGAEKAVDTALLLEPDHPLLLLERARLRLKLGKVEDARADMRLVRPVAGESAGLLNNLCWTQAVAGIDLDRALADCDAALALRPSAAGFLDSRALVLLRLGRAAEALETYDRALTIEPRQATSLYGRGLANQALGQADAASKDRDAALRISSRAAEAFADYETSGRQ